MGHILRVRDDNGNVIDIPAIKGAKGDPGPALGVTNTAAVGQTVKITAVDEAGQPTEWEAVDMAGSGKAKTQKLIDVTFEEAAASLSVTLEHNFHRLFLVWSGGTSGVARTVDTDGNAVAGNLCVVLDTTSVTYNDRKIGQIAGNTSTWQNTSLLMEWSDDMSTFINAMALGISTGTNGGVHQCFGGARAMAGTLSETALAPTQGRTLYIAPSTGLFAATTRIIMVGEYYE